MSADYSVETDLKEAVAMAEHLAGRWKICWKVGSFLNISLSKNQKKIVFTD